MAFDPLRSMRRHNERIVRMQNSMWIVFFPIFGVLMIIIGILGIFNPGGFTVNGQTVAGIWRYLSCLFGIGLGIGFILFHRANLRATNKGKLKRPKK